MVGWVLLGVSGKGSGGRSLWRRVRLWDAPVWVSKSFEGEASPGFNGKGGLAALGKPAALREAKSFSNQRLGSPPGTRGAFSLPIPCLKQRGFWPWQSRVVQEPGPTTPPLASPPPLPFHPTGVCGGGESCGRGQEGMGCPSPQKPDPGSWVKMRSTRSPKAAPRPLTPSHIPRSTGVSSKTPWEGAGLAASPVPAPRAGRRWQQDVAPGSRPWVTPS